MEIFSIFYLILSSNVMKKLIPLLIILSTWMGCITVEFEVPQPDGSRELKKFPRKFRGSYLNEDDGLLVITKNSFIAGHVDSIQNGEETFLSDKVILKRYKKYYMLNTLTDKYWESRLVELKDDSLLIYELNGEDENVILKLKEITSVKEILDEKGEVKKIIINPTKSEFSDILKAGLFSRILAVKKIE